jgi:AraC-like DNA-binding protein
LTQRHVVEVASVRAIAAEVGCNPSTVSRALAAAGLRRDSNGARRRYPRLKDVDWLRERYAVQGTRIGDIADEVGCGELAVRAALARARLPLRGVPPQYPHLRDRSWLRLQYLEHRVSVRDIAREVGCDESAVYDALDAAAIARIRPRGGPPRQFPELDDSPWLRHRYRDQGRSQQELAAEIGCSIRAVRKALAKAQIPSRRPGRHTRSSSAKDV